MGESDLVDDFDVIGRIRLGERNAYSLLVQKYEVRIRGYCLNVLYEKEDAEDAAQEIFIKAFRALDSFRGDSSFGTWIFRIAVNHCRDKLKSRKHQKTQSLEQLVQDRGDSIKELVAKQDNPLKTIENRELLAHIFKSTSENHREVLVLKEVHGYSYKEIAEILDCSLDSVKSRLKRARKNIFDSLRHLFEN